MTANAIRLEIVVRVPATPGVNSKPMLNA